MSAAITLQESASKVVPLKSSSSIDVNLAWQYVVFQHVQMFDPIMNYRVNLELDKNILSEAR